MPPRILYPPPILKIASNTWALGFCLSRDAIGCPDVPQIHQSKAPPSSAPEAHPPVAHELEPLELHAQNSIAKRCKLASNLRLPSPGLLCLGRRQRCGILRQRGRELRCGGAWRAKQCTHMAAVLSQSMRCTLQCVLRKHWHDCVAFAMPICSHLPWATIHLRMSWAPETLALGGES